MKIKHDFFIIGITAFAKHFRERLREIYPGIEVYIANTGDEAYNADFEKETGAYQSTPRCVLDLDFGDISGDQLSSPHSTCTFNAKGEDGATRPYATTLRRIPITINIGARFTVDNIVSALEMLDATLNLYFGPRGFKFTYLGRTHIGAYNIDIGFRGNRNIEMAQDPLKRERSLDWAVSLNFQYPAYSIYGAENLRDAANTVRQWTHNTIQNSKDIDTITVPNS